ncbi:MAG TPA: DUF3152 domain-containing protein [Mycobacteriales bacterium]|nr:DUF3152 domain-containing protein [Mycobacteriales bacterium]
MRRLLLLVTLVGLVVAAVPATSGVTAGQVAQKTLTYEVRTKGAVRSDVAVFRRIAARTFNDRRGWSLGGSLRYREVASGGAFTLWLSEASQVPSFGSPCHSRYSCRIGRNVIINDDRWRLGTSTWTQVPEYRSYVLNHELGHWLGLGHTSCSRSGAPAAVMQQQSISLQGCVSNTWPLIAERLAVAQRQGVAVRSARPDLTAVYQRPGAATEAHVLAGSTGYQTFALRTTTALGPTASWAWQFLVVDRNRDGVDDVVGVLRHGGSGTTEVHVLDGASGLRRWQLRTTTALHRTDENWTFGVDDVDVDGELDLLAFAHAGGSGTTEVHVLSGATGFRSWLLHTPTALHRTSPTRWTLTTGDHDRDGRVDVYAIDRQGGSGRTEVHVLDGRHRFTRFSLHAASSLGHTSSDWEFVAEDLDGNGWSDLLAVNRRGASRTDLHVLRDRTYGGFLLRTPTGLPPTADAPQWHVDAD